MNRVSYLKIAHAFIFFLCVAAGPTVDVGYAQPYQGGIEQKNIVSPANESGASYPEPRLIPQASQSQTPISNSTTKGKPIQVGIQHDVVLPAGFIGSWMVKGRRSKVEAEPEFQSAAQGAFAPNTSNGWNITGSPGSGYQLQSDSGISTQLWVYKVQGNTAFIRYQHPIKNTMAQEVVVITLAPGGSQFTALEQVAIVKKGEPARAKVTYQLVGQRE